MAKGGDSLRERFPEHRVDLEPGSGRVRVRVGGEVVADSQATTVVRETRHDPVIYFPTRDVRFERLERTDHHTFCPFKGEASYWTIRAGGRVLDNAVWGYESPIPEVAGLADHVAFYADRVEWEKEA